MVSVPNCGLMPTASTICLILSALKSMNTRVSLSVEEGGEGGRLIVKQLQDINMVFRKQKNRDKRAVEVST